MEMELTKDNKYGDKLVAANERTLKEVGLRYKGLEVILDSKLGDGILACNDRTYNMLQKSRRSSKEPVLSHKKEKEYKYTTPELYALNKAEQVRILKSLGLSNKEIRKLRREKQRVERILELIK